MQGKGTESFWGKYIGVRRVCCADMELLDQGKQPEFVHAPERFGPLGFVIVSCFVLGFGSGGKGVMEVRNGDDVTGMTGQGTCEEAALVVDEMKDDHFEDLHRKPGEIGWACFRRSTPRKQSPDHG